MRGQFHQPFGPKRKCGGDQSLALKVSCTFTNKIVANSSSELEVTSKCYEVYFLQCIINSRVNLLMRKLRIKCWWNWRLVSILKNSKYCKIKNTMFLKHVCLVIRFTVIWVAFSLSLLLELTYSTTTKTF